MTKAQIIKELVEYTDKDTFDMATLLKMSKAELVHLYKLFFERDPA